MDEILNSYKDVLFPQYLLCVYASSKTYKGKDQYIEYFPINPDGAIEAGRAFPDELLLEFKENITQKLDETINYHGLVPDNLIYYHKSGKNIKAIFRTEETKRHLFFAARKGNPKSGTYHIPNILWVVEDNSLHVYSFKEWEGNNTKLLSNPFFNTRNGSVCLGTTVRETLGTSYQDLINSWVNGFYASEFVHESGNEIKGTYTELYKIMKSRVPYEKFKECHVTINNICEHI